MKAGEGRSRWDSGRGGAGPGGAGPGLPQDAPSAPRDFAWRGLAWHRGLTPRERSSCKWAPARGYPHLGTESPWLFSQVVKTFVLVLREAWAPVPALPLFGCHVMAPTLSFLICKVGTWYLTPRPSWRLLR